MQYIKSSSIKPVLACCILGLLIITAAWSYVQAELNPIFSVNEASEIGKICNQPEYTLKFFKVTNYDKGLQKATVFCIYEQSNQNRRLDLNKNDKNGGWRVVFSSQLNKERSWYWPIYI